MALPTGSEFVAQYAKAGYAAWEAAALEIARQGGLTPFPWTDLTLVDEHANTARLRVQTDFVAIGPLTDFVRLPMLPNSGQAILNLAGWLYPTPWLVYQIFAAAQTKLVRIPFVNRGADLNQYAAHSAAIDAAIRAQGGAPGDGKLISGAKKHIVVSNDTYQAGKVLIFGWYNPEPIVWPSNGIPYPDPRRQPIQPNSNAHGDFYEDYSHGIQAIGPDCIVTEQGGQPVKMKTVDLYQHPKLWTLVSKDGPLKVPRYPAIVAPQANVPTPGLSFWDQPQESGRVVVTPTLPNAGALGLASLIRRA